MSLPSTLYKFSDSTGANGILASQCLRTKSPLDFNDPFEALPAYDEVRKNYMITTRREFYDSIGQSGMGSLIAEGNEESIPVESWVGLSAREHDQFSDRVSRQYRVLCLSENSNSTLLWSHYAQSHYGIAIGFNLQSEAFPKGRIPQGIRVEYLQERSNHMLPLDFYRHNALSAFDSIPDGYSRLHDGTIITTDAHNKMYVECLINILSTKHDPWKYEEEIRLLYHIATPNRDELTQDSGFDVARFSSDMVTEVIFGYRCPIKVVEETAEMVKKTYPSAKLGYVDLHPYRYEVRVHFAEIAQILAAQKTRKHL